METVMRSTRLKREQVKRIKRLTEAQAALGWAVILVLAGLLGAIYLSQASQIASVGRHVKDLQAELIILNRRNASLEREIAEAQSLERLQQEALRLGFFQAKPDEIEYIIVPDYPVTADLPPADVLGEFAATPPETMEEALWLAIKASFGNMIYGEAGE